MAIVKTETYICDICKKESGSSNFQDRNNCGICSIAITGHVGSKTFQGDWGGISIDKKYKHVCWECSPKIIHYIEQLKSEAGQ